MKHLHTVESRFKKDYGSDQNLSEIEFFFKFQIQENPLKSITLQNEHLKQYKCLITLSLSNASDYICRYFHPLIRKIWKYIFLKTKIFDFFSDIALKLSKSPYFLTFSEIFLS